MKLAVLLFVAFAMVVVSAADLQCHLLDPYPNDPLVGAKAKAPFPFNSKSPGLVLASCVDYYHAAEFEQKKAICDQSFYYHIDLLLAYDKIRKAEEGQASAL